MMRFLPFVLAGALPVLACSSQVDPSYRGEPLLSVAGRVVAPATAAKPVEIDAAIAWVPVQYLGNKTKPTLIAARVPVTTSFPTSFRLDAMEPPPFGSQQPLDRSELFEHHDEEGWEPKGYAFGVIVALARSAGGPAVDPGDVLGVDRHHTVLWFDHDAAEGETELLEMARASKVPATRGYHLIERSPEARAERERCFDAGVCVRSVLKPCNATAYWEGLLEYQHAQCLAQSGTPCTVVSDVTCNGGTHALTAEEAEGNARCAALKEAAWGPDSDPSPRFQACEDAYQSATSALAKTEIVIDLGQPIFAAVL